MKLFSRRKFLIIGAAATAATLIGVRYFRINFWLRRSNADDQLAFLSIKNLEIKMQKQMLSPSGLTSFFLSRISKFDGKSRLNAFVSTDPMATLHLAKEMDSWPIEQHARLPLYGIPIAIKDNLLTKDFPTTCGSEPLRDWRPQKDAEVVRRLRNAGALIIGKTNLSEFAMGITTENVLFGQTRNPWDLSRIPGGSSGGSAAAVAAGLCTAAIGTDTAGSVRIPAAHCGLVGFRPSTNFVPRDGLLYLSKDFDSIGPITRTVEDAQRIFQIMSGRPAPLATHDKKNILAGKKIALLDQACEGCSPEIIGVIQTVAEKMISAGAQVTKITINSFDKIISHAKRQILIEAPYSIQEGIKQGNSSFNVETEYKKFSSYIRSNEALWKKQQEAAHNPRESLKQSRMQIQREVSEIFQKFDALYLPTTMLLPIRLSDTANYKNFELFNLHTRNNHLANVLDLPAINLPGGLSSDGLPIGVQLVGNSLSDDSLLALAHSLEAQIRFSAHPNDYAKL